MVSHLQDQFDFRSCISVECPVPSIATLNRRAKQLVEGLSFVYILICSNNAFYVGISDDVEKRLQLHRNGHGARQTKQLKEFKLVYTEGPMERDSASKRERQLKKWSRAKKIALISVNIEELKILSKSNSG